MANGERRLAAIMFTDLSGFTLLAQRNESLSLEMVDESRRILRPLFARHNGKEIKTIGDAFLVEFPSALDSVRCAYTIQRTLWERNQARDSEHRVNMRIGVHLGDVVQAGGDIMGDAVNIASRIQQLAQTGGICVTRQVYDQVANKFELPLVSMGRRALKNVAEPMEVFRVDLPWASAPAAEMPSQDRRRIAVLPFANLSPEARDEYFADGMTEELISTLSGIEGLSVISRTSVMNYRNPSKRAGEISRELNAGTLLEGSVRKSENKVRITVQLIDPTEDEHLWSGRFDRELGDVFAVQGEIAERVAAALRAELLPSAKQRIERGRTKSTRAHTSYLTGLYHVNKATSEDLAKAIEAFKRAIAEDAEYADAHAALSLCYTYIAGVGMDEREAFPQAATHANRAIELDEDLSDGHLALGIVALQFDWDWAKTEAELKRAIKLNPSYSAAHMWYAVFLAVCRDLREALAEIRLAEELDPLSTIVKLNFGALLFQARLYDQAEAKLKESLDLEEGNKMTRLVLGQVYTQESMFEEALAELKAAAEGGEMSIALGSMGFAQAVSGRTLEAKKTLESLLAIEAGGSRCHTELAMVCLGLGEKDHSLSLLEEAAEQRESWFVLTCGFPFFDSLRSDPRYVRLMRRHGLSP